MNRYPIIPFLGLYMILLMGCGSKDFQRDYFTVERAISGNELLLINGYRVHLIGVENKSSTEEYLKNNMPNQRVRFFFDSKSPLYRISANDPEKAFYAYVILDDGTCINSFLLRNNYSDIPSNQYYLHDSLDPYLRYTSNRISKNNILRGKLPEEIPHYSKDVKPPPSPFEDKLIIESCEDLMEPILTACDYTSPIVRNLAVSIARLSEGMFNIGQVSEVFRAARTKWKYVNDPKGMEFFSKASQTIMSTQFSGDCDDYAILMYALITAIGGDARIVFAWGPMGGHAFTEVDITKMDFEEIKRTISNRFSEYEISSIHYQIDSEGNKWLNLDWWAAHPGGKYLDYDRYMVFYPRQNICIESQ